MTSVSDPVGRRPYGPYVWAMHVTSPDIEAETADLIARHRRDAPAASISITGSRPNPEPARRLRLALARQRDAGKSFPVAWRLALAEVAPGPSWSSAFEATKKAWRSGYDDTGSSLALAMDDDRGQPTRARMIA